MFTWKIICHHNQLTQLLSSTNIKMYVYDQNSQEYLQQQDFQP